VTVLVVALRKAAVKAEQRLRWLAGVIGYRG
jgi:hypothetical protein